MRREGDYILGTPAEIAIDYARNTRASRDGEFIPEMDFKVYDDEVGSSLEEIFDKAWPIFGIKRISTGFDNGDVDLFADYYGGGYGEYACIFREYSENEIAREIKGMLIGIVCNYGCSESRAENQLLIATYI